MNFTTLKNKLFSTDCMQVGTRDATKNLFTVFRFLGVDMPTTNKLKYAVYSGVVNGLVTIFLPISFTISLITSSSDMKMSNLLTSLQAAINVYACTAKIVIMSILLKRLRKAEVVMDKLDARCVAEDEKEQIRKVVKFGNRLVILFGLIYYSYSTSTFLTSVVSGTPPYSLYIPLVNWRNSTAEFVIAAVMEYALINVACTQQIVDDSYPVIYIGILRHYVRLLLLRISKLGMDPTKSKKENTQELVNCIIDHKNIIALFDIIHPVISKTIFVQFVITAVILSTTLVNVIIFADLPAGIASLIYILAVVVEVLPCCHYANCLMVESGQFGNTIFHSNWIVQEVAFRKMLVLFIQSSQKPITLTAGKIFPINLNSFLGIAKFSFSLYTFLSQMEYSELYQD